MSERFFTSTEEKNVELVKFLHPDMNICYHADTGTWYEGTLGVDTVCYGAIMREWVGHPDAYLPSEMEEEGFEPYQKDGVRDRHYAETQFFEYIGHVQKTHPETVYFSLNSFYRRYKAKKTVRHLNAFVVDYDFYKKEQFQTLTPAEFYEKHVKDRLPIQPTAVIDSGRGLYTIFAIEHAPKHACDLYWTVGTAMVESLKDLGADPRAHTVTQVIRVPGSVNERSGRTVEILDFQPLRYTMKQLADLYLPEGWEEQLREQRQKRQKEMQLKKRRKKRKKTASTTAPRKKTGSRPGVFSMRIDDLFTLARIRKARKAAKDYTGYREFLLYLCWDHCLRMGMTPEACERKVLQLNASLLEPMDEKILLVQCRPSSMHPCPHSNKKIIEYLAITPEEMKHLRTIVTKEMGKARKAKKARSRRRTQGKTSHEVRVMKRRQTLLQGLARGQSLDEIAKRVGASTKTLKRDLDACAARVRTSVKRMLRALSLLYDRSARGQRQLQIYKFSESLKTLIEDQGFSACADEWSRPPELLDILRNDTVRWGPPLNISSRYRTDFIAICHVWCDFGVAVQDWL